MTLMPNLWARKPDLVLRGRSKIVLVFRVFDVDVDLLDRVELLLSLVASK